MSPSMASGRPLMWSMAPALALPSSSPAPGGEGGGGSWLVGKPVLLVLVAASGLDVSVAGVVDLPVSSASGLLFFVEGAATSMTRLASRAAGDGEVTGAEVIAVALSRSLLMEWNREAQPLSCFFTEVSSCCPGPGAQMDWPL